MNHLIVSREYPPSSYAQGGIGTYVAHIARLLADHGETVHVIGEQHPGAPLARETRPDGRLTVHRVSTSHPVPGDDPDSARDILRALRRSEFAGEGFAWQVARLAESLVVEAEIDCIEAQEYEAPLYYFLLRRALGLGPDRCPPCVVHLHSPTQLICHYNDWEIGRPDHLRTKRLEDYVIQASDAVLCPSRYLARQAERHYGFAPGSIAQIPYPYGDTPRLQRTAATWSTGTICYVGRMEPRKGVFEWIEAAAAVAQERPGLRFELIGADTSPSNAWPASVRGALQARIPERLRGSISFLDPMPREALRTRLAEARMAVVPSRWENYPNTCVEAMSTGLPVLVTAEGGMVEMVTDGRTGWIADTPTAEALAATLKRALDTSPDTMAAMGRAAADDIRERCDNTSTVERQLAFRRRVTEAGASRSTRVPQRGSSVVLFASATEAAVPEPARSEGGRGLVTVIELESPEDVDDAVADLVAQTQRPVAVVVDAPAMSDATRRHVEQRFRDAGLPVVAASLDNVEGGIWRASGTIDGASGVALRTPGCRLEPQYLEMSATVLAKHAAIGVLSHWHRAGRRGEADLLRPMPARPYQWVVDDISPCAVFRLEALAAIDWRRDFPAGPFCTGDIGLAVMLGGWQGLTVPAFLSRRARPLSHQRRSLERAASVHFRQAITARSGPAYLSDAGEVLGLVRGLSDPLTNEQSAGALLRLPLHDQVRIARRALKNPRQILTWVTRSAR